LGFTCAILLASASGASAQSEQSAVRNGLTGTWLVEVTLRNCATNGPLGAFRSLVTFHRGGTLTESTSSPVFAIGQRSSGHGTWSSDDARIFSQRMVSLINFDTAPNLPGTPGFNPALPVGPGFFAGWATVTQTTELIDADHFTSFGTNDFYKTGETSPYRSGCSSSVGTRFE
jgi:hypothetical protein